MKKEFDAARGTQICLFCIKGFLVVGITAMIFLLLNSAFGWFQ